MKVAYSTLSAAIDDRIECHVTVSRETFRGFGMLIAEVGLPPGAEVDRGILQALVDGWKNGVDAYEVAPDHVTFYVWPQAAGVDFRFAFRPRYAMKARAAQSVLYDFYNPDDRVTIRPVQFVVGK
jgi:A-macroglobulin receptor binding domain